MMGTTRFMISQADTRNVISEVPPANVKINGAVRARTMLFRMVYVIILDIFAPSITAITVEDTATGASIPIMVPCAITWFTGRNKK